MIKKTVAAFVAASFLAGCSTDPYTGEQKVSNAAGGAALGALAGAGLGLLAGGNDRRNALLGAGIGALAGGAIGADDGQERGRTSRAAGRHRRQRHARRRPDHPQHAVRHHLRGRPGCREAQLLSRC